MVTIGSPQVRRLSAVAVASTVSLLVGAAGAGAEIVPQEGIAGAKLGKTQAQIVDKLGKPDRTRTNTTPFSGGT